MPRANPEALTGHSFASDREDFQKDCIDESLIVLEPSSDPESCMEMETDRLKHWCIVLTISLRGISSSSECERQANPPDDISRQT